jgi:hypothetical protein
MIVLRSQIGWQSPSERRNTNGHCYPTHGARSVIWITIGARCCDDRAGGAHSPAGPIACLGKRDG